MFDITYYLLPITYYLLPITYYLLPNYHGRIKKTETIRSKLRQI